MSVTSCVTIHILTSLLFLLRLRVVDAKKRKDKHKENEAIQFDFDMEKDNPDKIAEGMVKCSLSLSPFFVPSDSLGL